MRVLLASFCGICLVVMFAALKPASGKPPAKRGRTSSAKVSVTSAGPRWRRKDGVDPAFLYLSRLYDRLRRREAEGCDVFYVTSGKTSQGIMGLAPAAGRNGRTLIFDLSNVIPYDNITLAQVAIATQRRRHRNPRTCHSIWTAESGQLHCRRKPLGIRHLRTFDVTSELRTRPSKSVFRVFLQNADVTSSLLVLFRNVNTQQLFSAPCTGRTTKSLRESSLPRDFDSEVNKFPKRKILPSETEVVRLTSKLTQGYDDYDKRTSGETMVPSDRRGGDSFKKKNSQDVKTEDSHQARYRLYLEASRRIRDMEAAGQQAAWNPRGKELHPYASQRVRQRRQADSSSGSGTSAPADSDECRVRPFVVDPVELNLVDVLSPRSLPLGTCWGRCPATWSPADFVNGNRTNYYRQLVNLFVLVNPRAAAERDPPVVSLNCVPARFEPLTVLFLDGNGILSTERWAETVVTECRCASSGQAEPCAAPHPTA